jgi:hypothetical protein
MHCRVGSYESFIVGALMEFYKIETKGEFICDR